MALRGGGGMPGMRCDNSRSKRQLMLTASVIALLAASSAEAQEFPNFAASSGWQGVYAGLHGGYGWGETDSSCFWDSPFLIAPNDCDPLGSYSTDGVIAGAQIGYNWKLAGFLVGLESDISFTDIEGDAFFGGKVGDSADSSLDWMATLRARAGAPVTDSVLIYGTGGVAWGDWEDGFVPSTTRNSWSNVETGWTAGGGVETKVTEWVSIKAEYLYVDFGDKTHTFSEPSRNPPTGTVTFDHHLHTVRVGLNVKLN